MKRTRLLIAKLTGTALLLGAWQLASRSLGDDWVPGIASVLQRLAAETARGALLRDIGATTLLLAIGTFLGMLAGCALACALRLSARIDRMVQPLVTAVMSVPKLGLVPLLVLWFGTGWMPKVMLVTLTVLFIVFSFVYSGLVTIDQRLVMTARVMGASAWQVTRGVVLPAVWPFVLTGLEVALPWAVSAALVAEYLAAGSGIGHAIEQARQLGDAVGIFYGIVLATVLVLACNGVLGAAKSLTLKGPQEMLA